MEQITSYKAFDGKLFDTPEACEAYENDKKDWQENGCYWVIRHSPDLTEGRGFQSTTYLHLKTFKRNGHNASLADAYVADWCFKTMQSPLTFGQGGSPNVNYTITPMTWSEFSARTSPEALERQRNFKLPKVLVMAPSTAREAGLVEVLEK